MYFEIFASNSFFKKNEHQKEIAALKSIGISFRDFSEDKVQMYEDKVHDGLNRININSIEDLLNIVNGSGSDIILSGDSIEIYNGYRE